VVVPVQVSDLVQAVVPVLADHDLVDHVRVDLVRVQVLVVLALVAHLVVVPVLVLALVAQVGPAAHVLVVALAVRVLVVALVAQVGPAAVLVVRAMVNAAHPVRSLVHVVVVSSKNCSRNSLNTRTAMLRFPREQSLLSVDHRLKSSHPS
jgi:hypothetical protein